jgi:hypothetical protein
LVPDEIPQPPPESPPFAAVEVQVPLLWILLDARLAYEALAFFGYLNL